MSVSSIELSKAIAHALRHAPWQYELELDAEGWAPVGQLLDALHANGGAWRMVDRDALAAMMKSSVKQRYELAGEQIRARYGHSVAGRIVRARAEPPELLYHGTAPESWEAIQVEGLRPMRRQYVHLSVDLEIAMAVGKRKSKAPSLLSIAAADAATRGTEFYTGNDEVWLALRIPAEFISLA